MDRRPLFAAATCAALATAVYLAAVHVALARRVDVGVLAHAITHQTPERAALASDVIWLFNPGPFVVLTAALVIGAALAGRARAGIAAGSAIIAAAVSAEALKQLLAVQRAYPADHYMPAASWPSAHTTAAVSLLLGLVIVLPPRLRPPAALLGGATVAAALGAIILMGFHYPSDVVGGVLVATGWSAVALAVSGSGPAPTAARPRPRLRRATG